MSFPGPPFDTELEAVLKEFQQGQVQEEFTAEFIVARRKLIEPQCNIQVVHDDPDISSEEITIPGPGGDIILLILRSKSNTKENAPCIYHIHGGAMVLGNRFYLVNTVFPTIKELGAVLVSVEYRLAPEHPAPAAVDDCYAGLQWVFKNTTKLGIDGSKIIVYGGSAGGGLAAGVALLSRDRKDPPLFAQLLIYPMLDDRNTSVSVKQFYDLGLYTGRTNTTCWDHYLPGIRGTDKVGIYDAPARAKDLSGLPQTFIEVGASEPFRDEDVAYATKLWEHGVQAELHVWPGAW
jgi:acetyl esterase/lipase